MMAEAAQITGLGKDRQGIDRSDAWDHPQKLIIAVRGQRVMGVLLFQDLAVVPLLVLIPALSAPADADLLITLGVALLKGAVLVGATWTDGRRCWQRSVGVCKSDSAALDAPPPG